MAKRAKAWQLFPPLQTLIQLNSKTRICHEELNDTYNIITPTRATLLRPSELRYTVSTLNTHPVNEETERTEEIEVTSFTVTSC